MVEKNPKYSFSSAGKGLLAQEDPSTDDSKFNHLTSNFGLLSPSWNEFHENFLKLKRSAPKNVRYKVLYLARHGQGFHNLAVDIYGQKEWDDYWAALNGDGKIVWGPDPELTELGISQAKDNHDAWKEQISKKNIHLPTAFYSSPFTRALDTMRYTWDGILLDEEYSILDSPPLVIEDLREDMGGHTCDKRRTRSYIEKRFGNIADIESSFTEEDELWGEDYRETPLEHNIRTERFLDRLFGLDWDDVDKTHDYVSVTSHSGTINSFLHVIEHRKFSVGTGGMIPVIVRAEKL